MLFVYSIVQKQTQLWGLQGEYKGFLRRIYHMDCAGRGYLWFGDLTAIMEKRTEKEQDIETETGVLAGKNPSKNQMTSYESLLTSVVVGNISVARNAYLDLAQLSKKVITLLHVD